MNYYGQENTSFLSWLKKTCEIIYIFVKEKDYELFFKKFGQRCKEIRLKKGWTQEDMLQHGFATRHYQRIEGGLTISMTTALRLADAFGVKLSYLIKGIE